MKIRSTYFDRTSGNDTTIRPGYWCPVLCYPTLIGDHWRIDVGDVIRNMPRLAPTYGTESVRVAAFYVQNKDIMDDWWDFRTGGMDNLDTTKLPYMLHKGSEDNTGFNTLSDYLSTAPALTFYDRTVVNGEVTYSKNNKVVKSVCLAERAYAKIGRDYLMKQTVETEDDYPLSTANGDSGEDTVTNRDLFPCHWNHDYFTNMVPSQVRGSQVTIPIGTEAPITLGSAQSSQQLTTSINGIASSSLPVGIKGISNAQQGIINGNQVANLYGKTGNDGSDNFYPLLAKLDETAGFSLSSLNLGVAVDRIGNYLMRHGSRPVEWMNTFFGVRSSDARLDRAQFLGSYSTDFVVSPVTQTSSTDAVTAQGHQAGQGFHAAKYPTFSCYCEEDGWIMVLVAIRPKTQYAQGLPPYHNYNSRYDYPNPLFQHLDYVPAKNSELYCQGVANGNEDTDWDSLDLVDNQTFALHPIFQEWRSFPRQVHGDLLGDLDYWTVFRKFFGVPSYGKEFMQVGSNFPMRQFALTDSTRYPPYICSFNFRIRLRRKLSKFGTPKYFGVIG